MNDKQNNLSIKKYQNICVKVVRTKKKKTKASFCANSSNRSLSRSRNRSGKDKLIYIIKKCLNMIKTNTKNNIKKV